MTIMSSYVDAVHPTINSSNAFSKGLCSARMKENTFSNIITLPPQPSLLYKFQTYPPDYTECYIEKTEITARRSGIYICLRSPPYGSLGTADIDALRSQKLGVLIPLLSRYHLVPTCEAGMARMRGRSGPGSARKSCSKAGHTGTEVVLKI